VKTDCEGKRLGKFRVLKKKKEGKLQQKREKIFAGKVGGGRYCENIKTFGLNSQGGLGEKKTGKKRTGKKQI